VEDWMLPEVNDAIIAWEKQIDDKLTARERCIFQFGFLVGQRNLLRENIIPVLDQFGISGGQTYGKPDNR
jgi:hypothetical protein